MTKKDIEAAAQALYDQLRVYQASCLQPESVEWQRHDVQAIADFAAEQVAKAVEECAVIAESKAADRCIKHQASGRGACGYQIANEIRAQAKDKIGL